MSRGGPRRLSALLAGLALLWAQTAAASPFSDWAAVVVAGDWRGAEGGPTEAFDNARRDVSAALEQAGFSRAAIRQFSTRPQEDRATRPATSEPAAIFRTLGQLARERTAGCLVYVSSHGTPEGVLVGDQVLPPRALAAMLDEACGERPTVVVISACFSGVFVPALAGPNRMVLTAARRDRTSFGCGQANRYPYFDECFLSAIDHAASFPLLAGDVRRCVADRELREGAAPPSEPQVYVGPALMPVLPLMAFER